MRLSGNNLGNITAENLVKPSPEMLQLPEKVLQFGTGALLRGLPDYFIDEANRKGFFNGRIVVVKSTGTGSTDAFDEQDGLYTLCIRGIEKGQKISMNIINGSISRVIAANENWITVLDLAKDPAVQIVISNTTEVGIQYIEESIFGSVPKSFPGKLLACLYARYTSFEDITNAGMIILPTELISDNGATLAAVLVKLAEYNKLDAPFIRWLTSANIFCNTLVDCIVPGYPDESFRKTFEADFGYTDQLLTVTEAYRLWAIEGDESLAQKLSFATLENGIVIAPDIQKFKELKLRLLNGTHTLSCGLAFFCGIPTVKAAMDDPAMAQFISDTMLQEIAPAIPYSIPTDEALSFAHQVLDRFRNPGIAHPWLSITMQYSSKIRQRCIPVLQQYVNQFNTIPRNFALGFAAYLLFSKATKKEGEKYFGNRKGNDYVINDDQAAYYYELWQYNSYKDVVKEVLRNPGLWGTDLSHIPGFEVQVTQDLEALMNEGGMKVLQSL
nr:tagaturonate reductase [Flavihumibacter fluvii]